MSYLPLKQTPEAEMAYKQMLEAVERLKEQMGAKYLLAKENAVKRTENNHE